MSFEPGAQRDGWNNRLQHLIVGVSLALLLLVGWRIRPPLFIRGSDELIYMSLSHSLEQGQYRDSFLVGNPPHLKYPPFYPGWLIPVRHLTGESIDGVKLTNLLLAAAALLLIYLVARRLIRPWLAVAMVFLLATTPILLIWSGSLMSESLFGFLTIGSLGSAYRAEQKDSSALPAMAGAWLGFLTRTAGIALIAALGLWIWRRRRRAELLAFGLGSILVVGGWFGYTRLVPRPSIGLSYQADLALIGTTESEGSDRGTTPIAGLASVIDRIGSNAVDYSSGVLPTTLALLTIPGTVLDNLLWLPGIAVLLVFGGIVLWRAWRPALLYLILYGALLLVWPWTYARLLVPVLPLIMLALLAGAAHLTRKLAPRTRQVALALLVALLAGGTVSRTLAWDKQRRSCDRADPLHSAGCYQPEILGLIRSLEYVGKTAKPGDIVLSSEPVSAHYLTGHQAVPSEAVAGLAPGAAARRLRELGVRFAVLSAVRPGDRGPVARAFRESCHELEVVASFTAHSLVLVPAPPDAAARGGSDACGALDQFIQDVRVYDQREP